MKIFDKIALIVSVIVMIACDPPEVIKSTEFDSLIDRLSSVYFVILEL